jgi:hypothetical protein
MFRKKFNYTKNDSKKMFHNHDDYIYKKGEFDNEHGGENPACCISNKGNVLVQEFLCHLPMSILALSISLFVLILFDGFFSQISSIVIKKTVYSNLFHMSHYIHILFASFASFYAFSNNLFFSEKKIIFGVLLAMINSFLFCTLADMVLPTIGALFLDNTIDMHFCFLHYDDMVNAILFSVFGVFAAYCLVRGNKKYATVIAQKVHLGHVWFGCLAALFYLFSQLQIDIIINISFLFMILFLSVVIPCIFSDVCIPYFFNLYIMNKSNLYQGIKIEYK